jgi:hypothetical protein
MSIGAGCFALGGFFRQLRLTLRMVCKKRTAQLAIVLIATLAICGCKKTIRQVDGTINGIPTISLYGSSGKAADYILLSTDPAYKELAYGGNVFTYGYTGANTIIIRDSIKVIGRGSLDTNSTKTILNIDTSYSFTFGSKQYKSF